MRRHQICDCRLEDVQALPGRHSSLLDGRQLLRGRGLVGSHRLYLTLLGGHCVLGCRRRLLQAKHLLSGRVLIRDEVRQLPLVCLCRLLRGHGLRLLRRLRGRSNRRSDSRRQARGRRRRRHSTRGCLGRLCRDVWWLPAGHKERASHHDHHRLVQPAKQAQGRPSPLDSNTPPRRAVQD